MEYISKSLKETSRIATKILENLTQRNSATVLALYGDLGSGKTTLVQHIGKQLGIIRSIQSPTFVIMKSYQLKAKSYQFLIHIDAYRLEHSDELSALRFEEFLEDPKNLIAIEWAERVETLLPADSVKIRCTFADETTRKFLL